jgi:hypothetical protein
MSTLPRVRLFFIKAGASSPENNEGEQKSIDKENREFR